MTYRDTGLPSARDYRAVMAAGDRMDRARARVLALAAPHAGEPGAGQMALPLPREEGAP